MARCVRDHAHHVGVVQDVLALLLHLEGATVPAMGGSEMGIPCELHLWYAHLWSLLDLNRGCICSLQYFLPFATDGINDQIEQAILRADRLGVKVLSLAALNKVDFLFFPLRC